MIFKSAITFLTYIKRSLNPKRALHTMNHTSSRAVRHVYFGFALFLFILFAATIAYELAGWNFMDAFYMVIITVFGVGFGEVHPIDSPILKVVTIIVILSGTSAAVFLVSAFIRMITEGEIKEVMEEFKVSRSIEGLRQHTIVCGFGRMGQILARELNQAAMPFVILDNNEGRIQLALESGYLCVRGSAEEEDSLTKAHIHDAATLATVLPTDTVNVFVTLTARNMNPNLRIIARGENPTVEKKLYQAGADDVILPAAMGGLQIAHTITRPSLTEFIDKERSLINHDLRALGVRLEEIPVDSRPGLTGKSLLDFLKGIESQFMVLAVRKPDKSIVRRPEGSQILEVGDVLIVLEVFAEG